jgi:hypothetical protein
MELPDEAPIEVGYPHDAENLSAHQVIMTVGASSRSANQSEPAPLPKWDFPTTTKRAVSEICSEAASLPNLNKSDQSAAQHATDFAAPIYNVWKQQEKTAGSSRFDVRWNARRRVARPA